MKPIPRPNWVQGAVGIVTALLGFSLEAKVLDNFDSATRVGWEDANPGGLPLPGGTQAGGQFTFNLPPIGQPFFVSSRKTSETFELVNGRTIEMRVDLVSGRGPDSFAVVGFIPQGAGGPNSLRGYGMAKSETDILITKGINTYFFDSNPTPPIKNNNVTLVLKLSAVAGSVHITGSVLDKDAGNQVIWEETFVDSPQADVLTTGVDNPAAPYLNLVGNFVLYLYADGGTDAAGYQVVFDNAETLVTDTVVLDDFNAAQRSGWEDRNPANLPLPAPVQANGQYRIDLPRIGQPFFRSSTKTSTQYELAEGTRHEFAVDMISGLGPDSFAVLAWIPTATGANSLAGYGIAKSESDILITKGINKYFYNENPVPPIKNTNVRLTLELTVRKGSVEIVARILDLEDNNAVLFEQRFVDTPGADVFSDGADDPPAPYITTGNAVLYLYADGGTDPNGYQVVYDNLTVSAPLAAANLAPIISAVGPVEGANFLPTSTLVSYTVADDKALPDSAFQVTLNGMVYTSTNGVTLTAAGATRTATLGGLVAERNYSGQVSVTDTDGVTRSVPLHFDTYTAANTRVVELEDYNFESGGFFNSPVRTAEGWGAAENSYTDRVATVGIDVNETRTSPNAGDTMYRTLDAVRMQRSLDRARPGFSADNLVFDYDVGDLVAGEWMNYTRDFAAGSYEIYLREAVVNFGQADSALEIVTGDRTQPEQTVRVVGTFLGTTSGFTYRNVPLTDGTGANKVVLRLSGVTTLRLRTITADTSSGNRYLNYLLVVPVADAGVQRAAVASLTPANGITVSSVEPTVQVAIENRDTQVNLGTVQLQINGATVTPTVAGTGNGATVTYRFATLPPRDVVQSARLTFRDNEGEEVVTEWQFAVTYVQLDPATRFQGRGLAAGFNFKWVQALPEGGLLDNSLTRAEDQLRNGSSIPRGVDASGVTPVVNYSQNAVTGGTDGVFGEDLVFPGADLGLGDDNIASEFAAHLDLPAGIVRFGMICDDGFKLASAVAPGAGTAPLDFNNGGPANKVFDVVVPEAGLYAFRLVWYERSGGAHVEWFTEDRSTGVRTLVNGVGGVRAFATVEAVAPSITLQSTDVLGSTFGNEAAAVIDTVAKTVRITLGTSPARFYRLLGASELAIDSIVIEGETVVLKYR
jgi:hypothetical protein